MDIFMSFTCHLKRTGLAMIQNSFPLHMFSVCCRYLTKQGTSPRFLIETLKIYKIWHQRLSHYKLNTCAPAPSVADAQKDHRHDHIQYKEINRSCVSLICLTSRAIMKCLGRGVCVWLENITFHVYYSYLLIDEDFMSKDTLIMWFQS